VNVGNHGAGVRNIALNLGNSGVCLCNTLANVRNGHIDVQPKFCLGVNSQRRPCRNDRTYVKDKEDPVEAQPPAGDRLSIVLRVESSRDCILFTPLDDLAPDIRHGPAIGSMSYISEGSKADFNSRRQLIDPLEHRTTKFAQPLPPQSPVEGGTDGIAGQPKFDVVHFIDHRVLHTFCQSAIYPHKVEGKFTLIIVRITPTVLKTALAGVMLETFSAMFKPSMTTFNDERASSRRFDRRDLASMGSKLA